MLTEMQLQKQKAYTFTTLANIDLFGIFESNRNTDNNEDKVQ